MASANHTDKVSRSQSNAAVHRGGVDVSAQRDVFFAG